MKKTRLSRSLQIAFATGALTAICGVSYAQSTQRVEVTGSRIKRVDAESANPITVIGREEIERSGVTTLNEALQRITGAGGTLDDRTTNGFAPGGGGLNLRGLGFNSTLVLINGRRMPTYPFAQQLGTAQGFNDLQNIPLAAVERVEILKDGASAIYGADAVAGVVNIILRKEYQGLEIGADIGQSSRSDGNIARANLTGGFGNLARDRYNVLIGANVSSRDAIQSNARSWAGTEDLRPRGGSDRRSAYGDPGTIFDLVDPDADPYYMAGCGPTTQRGGSSIRGGICRYDRANYGALQPESKKAGLYGRLTFALTPDITTFAELMLTQNKFASKGWPAGTTDDVGLGSYIIPGGTPGNPFVNDAEVYYRFTDAGIRGDKGKSDTTRLMLGAQGVTAGWDWEAALNVNRIKIDNLATNNALNSRVLCLTNPAAAASYAAGGDPLGLGTLDDIFAANPSYASYFKTELAKCASAFATYGYYNYQNPSLNNPGIGAYIRHDSSRAGRSNLDGFDLRASRDLMQLGGGALGFAVGLDYRREKVSDIPDQQLQTGDTLSISAAQAFGSRKVMAVYGELNAPFTKSLEANFAVRYDKYSGNGDFASTSPKVGLKYKVLDNLALRATASKAFRAPSLFETTPAQQTAFTFGITDPINCPAGSDPETNPDCGLDVRRVQQGNPNLKPERSKSLTLGAIFEPANAVSIAVDLWKIDRKDEIGAFGDQLLVNLFPTNPDIVVRNPAGKIVQINSVPVQLNKTSTWGSDVELNMRHDLGSIGRLTSKVGVSYVASYKFSTLDDTGAPTTVEYNGTYNQPRYRTNWDFALARGPWEFSLGGYGVGAYEGLGTTTRVSGFEVWNLGLSYTGIKNLKLRATINNLLDKAPPFNDETSGSNAGYNAQFGDVVGRFFTIGAQYKF
jgi:iron complex outermembrane receptor protein